MSFASASGVIAILTYLIISTTVQASTLWMHVGEVLTLPAPSGKAVRVGSHGVIKVIDGDASVRVVALKAGTTPLIIGDKNYSVRVASMSQRDFLQKLKWEVDHMMGLKLDSETPVPALSGTLLRFSDWQRIAELSREKQGDYVFKAHVLPEVGEKAIRYFERIAKDKGYPIVSFRAEPEFMVQIPNTEGELREGATELFKPFGIGVETTSSKLNIRPLIRTRVILAEVSHDHSLEIGIKWPGEYNAQVLPNAAATDNLMATLHALESKGQAQILASPNLLCRSGSEARFHAGGSFPIRMFSRYNHDVVWKEHGVLLSVKPEADFQGAISLAIETEVSLLDMANSVDNIPALKTNTVKSHFDLPGKRTIALSGLLRQELGESREGLPFLQRIPLLGALFSSQKFMQHRSELVIFVTPEIHVPERDEKIEMPQGWVSDGV